MRIFITGGTGFIGSHLVKSLSEDGHELVLVARNRRRGKRFEQAYDNITFIYGDLLNNFSFDKHTKNIDLVIHLFWSNIPRNGPEFLKQDLINSVSYGIDMLEACVKNGVKKIVFASSGGTVYGIPKKIPTPEYNCLQPISSYGLTKSIFEKYVHFFSHQFDLTYSILRISNVYGPGQNLGVQQGVISHWIRNIIRDKKIELWGDGQAVRDYIYIDDVVQAITKVVESKDNEILNISSGQGVSLNMIISILKKDLKLDFRVDQRSFDKSDVPENILDNTLARKGLIWSPQVSLRDGIKLTHAYLINKIQNS